MKYTKVIFINENSFFIDAKVYNISTQKVLLLK